MSENNPTPEPAQDPKGEKNPTPEPKKAEETDWKAEARKWEQRAKENKGAAEKLAQIEEANKSELEKAQERIAELDRRATQAEQTALRTRIATEEGVIPEVLTGSTEEEMRAAAKRVLEWANQGKRPAPEPKKLKSGSSGESQPTGSRAAAALRQMRGSN